MLFVTTNHFVKRYYENIANHKRERVWIVANSNDRLSNGKNEEVRTGRNTFNNGSSDMANSGSERLEGHRREYELREDSEEGKVSRSSEDVANSERIGQQGSRKPIGPGNTETNSNGKTSGFTMAVKEKKGGGTLNPTWVEWLMGYPTGWTDLSPSETASSLKSPTTSDNQSLNQEK